MKDIIIITIKMFCVMLVCLCNPLAGLMMSQQIENDDDDCEI